MTELDGAALGHAEGFLAEARRWLDGADAADLAPCDTVASTALDHARPRVLVVDDNADCEGTVRGCWRARTRLTNG